MLYKKESIDRIKSLIAEKKLEVRNNIPYFNGNILKVAEKTKTFTLYYNDKLFQPKAALVVCILLNMDIPDNTEVGLKLTDIIGVVFGDNILFNKKELKYNTNPVNRTYSIETCASVRNDYRSGNYSFRDLEKKHNLNRAQISTILYTTSESVFWTEVNKLSPVLVKGEVKTKYKKRTGVKLSDEHKLKLSESMKRQHAQNLRPKVVPYHGPRKPKPKVEQVKVDKQVAVKKPITKPMSIVDIFRMEAEKFKKEKN